VENRFQSLPFKFNLQRYTAGSSSQPSGGGAGKLRAPVLSADAVLNLYSNCIKLASENKINAKNTWRVLCNQVESS
jgi:hypothetical protein